MTTTTLTSRRLAALAAPALLALSLTACGGGGSSAPEDASKEDFCAAYDADEGDDIDPEASPEEQAKALKKTFDEAIDKLKDAGTPKDIPDDAREGYEVFVDTISDLSEDDYQEAIESEDFDSLEKKIDADDQKKAEAFTDWADDYCGDDSSTGSGSEPSSDAS